MGLWGGTRGFRDRFRRRRSGFSEVGTDRTSVVSATGGETMSFQRAVGYAGDLLATDAYGLLASDAASALIDVRTQAEWAYVGAPDLQALGKMPLFLEWQG